MQIVSDRHIQIDNFLDAEIHQDLLKYVAERELDFLPTTTSTKAVNYRKSVVLHSFPEYADLLKSLVDVQLGEVCDRLATPAFKMSQIECQITSHNDGHFYKIHNDNGSAEAATRVITYVYYLYREPKAFSGGQLRLHKTLTSFEDIEPRNNSIVFFMSGLSHEVLPIQCPSGQFADSRFTVNGWVRK